MQADEGPDPGKEEWEIYMMKELGATTGLDDGEQNVWVDFIKTKLVDKLTIPE